MDTNHDGVVDADESFVSDGTGMHPTRTTYATATVAYSATQPTVTATPTPDTYHVPISDDAIAGFNLALADAFSVVEQEKWSNYQPHEYLYDDTTYNAGENKKMWNENFRPGYSWDVVSPFTQHAFENICPSVIFLNNDSMGRSVYYFFEVIYNDFQASRGYDNYNSSVDGAPGLRWPGMVTCVKSTFANRQRPRYHHAYENWFVSNYGSRIYAAPLVLPARNIGPGPCPTRPRKIKIDGTIVRDTVPNQAPVIQYLQLSVDDTWADNITAVPTFTSGPVSVASSIQGQSFVTNTSLAGMDYSRVWTQAFTGYSNTSFTGSGGQSTSLSAAQNNFASVGIVLAGSSSSYYSFTTIKTWQVNSACLLYSGWLRPGTQTQLCGWVIQMRPAGSTAAVTTTLVTTGYGVTSVSPTASSPGAGVTYRLTTSNTQSEILSKMAVAESTGTVLGFMYDGRIGDYGEVTWLSQI